MKKTHIACLLILVSMPLHAANADMSQEASLNIGPGNQRIMYIPENFSFNPIFFDPLASTATPSYKTLPPGLMFQDLTPAQQNGFIMPNQIAIEDATGEPFNIHLSFSNLIDGDKIVPFTDISMVTLAEDSSGIDIFTANSPPATTVDISAPVACPDWNNNIQTNCTVEFNDNAFTPDTTVHANDPINIIDESTTIIPVDPGTVYSINSIIEFSDGEKALIKEIAPNNSTITVRRGILGTTAATHFAASGIECLGPNSTSVSIIDGNEYDGRIGAYTVGFGFRLMVQPHFEPGEYTGLITITFQG